MFLTEINILGYLYNSKYTEDIFPIFSMHDHDMFCQTDSQNLMPVSKQLRMADFKELHISVLEKISKIESFLIKTLFPPVKK